MRESKANENKKYTCNDIFMIRTPSLPVKVFSDFLRFDGDSVSDFIQQNNLESFMDKSILVSSRELYKSKERALQKGSKKEKARDLSYLKYLTRAATRPTPYGLFAGVALGEFSEEAHGEPLVLEETKTVIECRIDHAWLSHFVYELENDPVVYPQLQVRFNKNCYVSGDRLKNPHYANHGFRSSKETVVKRNHIRNTPLVTLIKEETKEWLLHDALKNKIQNHYPGVPEEKIVAAINMLMDNEILLTNLRIPSNCTDGLKHVLNVLESIEGIDQKKEALRNLSILLHRLNSEESIEDISSAAVQEIYILMEGLLGKTEEKNFLAVNKGSVLKKNKLSREIKDTIERFIDGMTCLQVEMPSRLERFKRQFQEEYGTNIEVPLCEIIDPNRFNGLAYLDNDQAIQSEKDRKIKQIVDEKILFCLQSQGEEVILRQSDFESLEQGGDDRLPESFDINFFVTKEDNGYRLSLAPVGGSQAAGDMFNRFAHVMDSALFQKYKENNEKMIPLDSEVVRVELRESNTNGRLGNIDDRSGGSPYYFAIATYNDEPGTNELTLEDLLIGMQNNCLYVKSKSLGKRCKVCYDCMINLKILSDLARLLLYVSYDDETSLLSRIYNLFGNNYIHTPRIVFENVVTHPKSWNFPASLFALNTLQDFDASFQTLREKYNIDNIVYLVEMDNRLALNLDKTYSHEILYKHICKHGALRLSELEKNLFVDGTCLDCRRDNYVPEISCSLLRSARKENQILLNDSLDYTLQEEKRALALLQSGWIYVKLYHMDDRENEVLSNIVASLSVIGAPNFFYLRYSDEIGRHLRVRFQYSDEAMAQRYLPNLQTLLNQLREYRLINMVKFDLYNRENNRYGGSRLIEFAEHVFFVDSLFVINLLNEFNTDKANELEQAYLLGISTILTAVFDRLGDMFEQVDLIPLQEENRKIFRKNKQAYISKVEKLLSRDFSSLSNKIYLSIIERDQVLKEYWNNISGSTRLTNKKESIIASVIHMFCNRLTGDRSMEQKYLNIMREALVDIIEKKRRLVQKEF